MKTKFRIEFLLDEGIITDVVEFSSQWIVDRFIKKFAGCTAVFRLYVKNEITGKWRKVKDYCPILEQVN